jgi:hypothetical protein
VVGRDTSFFALIIGVEEKRLTTFATGGQKAFFSSSLNLGSNKLKR